jgi:hypothetical protein
MAAFLRDHAPPANFAEKPISFGSGIGVASAEVQPQAGQSQ